MNETYVDLLTTYIYAVWKLILIPIAVFIAVMVIDLIKRKGKIIKDKKISKVFLVDVFLIVGVIVIGLIHTVPVQMDIKENSVEKVSFETAYYHNQSYMNGDSMLGLNPVLVELDDGTKLELGDSTFDFPFEVENGTIIYAKHSKIILEYSGKVTHNDSF